MKTKFSATLSLVFLSLSLNAQFILVGQHSSNDYYVDIIPDTLIAPVCQQGQTSTYSIDLNGDGSIDFQIKAWCVQAGGAYGGCSKIVALNGNQIIFDHNDTCFYYNGNIQGIYPIAKPQNLNDTVSINNNWVAVSSMIFIYSYGEMQSFNCSFVHNFSYVGVRIFADSDTLYGWIKLTPTYHSVSIKEFACNISPYVNVHEHNALTKIYPNPNNGILTLELGNLTENATLELFSLEGKPVSEIYYYNVSKGPLMRLDISNLKKGLYLLKINSIEKTGYEKILIF